jgi:hypothetical protein
MFDSKIDFYIRQWWVDIKILASDLMLNIFFENLLDIGYLNSNIFKKTGSQITDS